LTDDEPSLFKMARCCVEMAIVEANDTQNSLQSGSMEILPRGRRRIRFANGKRARNCCFVKYVVAVWTLSVVAARGTAGSAWDSRSSRLQ
jgi:hypothetical protein